MAEGCTNREIAGQLFLSEKTVEKHLAAIFDRLGVTRRVAVATALARESSSIAAGSRTPNP